MYSFATYLMKKILLIQLKAAFLLAVFLLNMIVGFACSVGVNMGFNTNHHNDVETGIIKSSSHHDETNLQHSKSKENENDCCKGKVTSFAQLDKAVPPSINLLINPLFLIGHVSAFYNIDILISSQSSPNIKIFVRSYHPPIQDIRLAIQSFQI